MISQEELKRLLHYNPETGVFTWLVASCRAAVGQTAGFVCNDGYVIVKVRQRAYKAHRLAFVYVSGSFPMGETDHINGVKSDNRWSNLRNAKRLENAKNIRLKKNNKSGSIGVHWHKGQNKWAAHCQTNNKRYHLGYFNTVPEASAVYEAFAKEHFGEFYRKATT